MGVQDIIVMIVLVACVIWVGFRIYRLIQRHKNKESLCSGCSMGCSCGKSALSKEQTKDPMNGTHGSSCCPAGNKDLKYRSKN